MDEGWIITTAITLGIGVISYFLKNHEPVGLHSPAASKNRTGFCNKSRSEGNYRRIKKDINKIREDYTPKETHSKDFDGCQKEIKEIRQNYLTKDDFIREINKVDRKGTDVKYDDRNDKKWRFTMNREQEREDSGQELFYGE